MWRILSSICLFFSGCFYFCSCSSAPTQDEERAMYHLQMGSAALVQGKNPVALTELGMAEELDPDNPVIQNNLGLAYLARKKIDLAEVHIRKAISINKNYSDARNNLGRVLIESGRHQDAIEQFKIVIQDLKYEFPERPYVNMGIAYFNLANYNVAQTYFIKAIEYQRENCFAQAYLGRTFYELKDYKRATEQLDKAVTFCRKNQYDEPLYYSALAYYQLGQKQKTEARLDEVIKMYPNGLYSDKARNMLDIIRR